MRETVFDMDPLSIPEHNGYAGRFYRHCWDIIGQDIVLVVQQFFRTGHVFPELNSNFIVLVPKTSTALTVDQF